MKKYYLNNFTDKVITISLSTKRTIKAFSSLSLNNKDVQIYKNLKNKRNGKPSLLDGLVFSTIKIENDARYTSLKASIKENVTVDEGKDNKEAEEKAKKELEKQAKKEAKEQAKKETEEAAKKELEEKAKKEAEGKDNKEAEEKAKKEAEEKEEI